MPQNSYTLGNLLQDCLDCDIRKMRLLFQIIEKLPDVAFADVAIQTVLKQIPQRIGFLWHGSVVMGL